MNSFGNDQMEEREEELLQRLWIGEEEEGGGLELSTLEKEVGSGMWSNHGMSDGYREALGLMEERGLISLQGSRVFMMERGREVARTIVRNHRLAERLLMEVFEVGDREAHSSACRFEHILSPEVTDRVCAFLGHPPTCPHGKAIPRGECCKIFGTHIEPLVQPLTSLDVGKRARIVFIMPGSQARLERLGSLGLSPGGILRLKQRFPSYVVEIDETTVALDKEVGKEIFVREVS